MNYHERIVRDPRIVGGQAVFKGTRVTLRTVLASLAEGATTAEILADVPTLSEEDVRAAVVFAATSAKEDLPVAELSAPRHGRVVTTPSCHVAPTGSSRRGPVSVRADRGLTPLG